jgi:hypothetical protein
MQNLYNERQRENNGDAVNKSRQNNFFTLFCWLVLCFDCQYKQNFLFPFLFYFVAIALIARCIQICFLISRLLILIFQFF